MEQRGGRVLTCVVGRELTNGLHVPQALGMCHIDRVNNQLPRAAVLAATEFSKDRVMGVVSFFEWVREPCT